MSEQEIVGQVVTTDKLIPSLTVNPEGQIVDHTGRIVGKLAESSTVLRRKAIDVFVRSDGNVFSGSKEGPLIGKLRNNEVKGLLGQRFGNYFLEYGPSAAAAYLGLRSAWSGVVVVHYFKEEVVERGCLEQLFRLALKAGLYLVAAFVAIVFVMGAIMTAISFIALSSPIWIAFLIGSYISLRTCLTAERSASEPGQEPWEIIAVGIRPIALESGFVVATSVASLVALLAWGSVPMIFASAGAVGVGWLIWSKLADKQAQAFLARQDQSPKIFFTPKQIISGVEFVSTYPRKGGMYAVGLFGLCAAISIIGSTLSRPKPGSTTPSSAPQVVASNPVIQPPIEDSTAQAVEEKSTVSPVGTQEPQPTPDAPASDTWEETPSKAAPPPPVSPAPQGWNWVLLGSRYSIAPIGWGRSDSIENGVIQAKFTKGEPDTNVTFQVHPKGSVSPQQFVESEEARYKSSAQFKYERVRVRLGSEAFHGGAIWNFRLAENGGRLNQRMISYFEMPEATYEISLSYQADLPGKPYRTYFDPLFANFSKWK